MTPDPKPRKRVKDPDLLDEYAARKCQVTGLGVGIRGAAKIDTHHLIKHPRHDEEGNLFRILHSLHMEFEQGTRRRAVGALIRAYMTEEQMKYVAAEKGGAWWLDEHYPNIEWMSYE